MKKGKRLLALLLIAVLLLPFAAVTASAEYTYTVRFYSGRQGSFGGQEVQVYTNLHYGDRVTFDRGSVTLNDDSKYYIKGIRESGRDNNTVGYTSFLVTKDQDYVVAYGILGNAVAYTVNYLDQNGVQLAPSETFYGNVGDKPVVAYRHVEGYLPLFYNLTKTLTENAADNVIDFYYYPLPEGGGGGDGPAVIVIEDEGTTTIIEEDPTVTTDPPVTADPNEGRDGPGENGEGTDPYGPGQNGPGDGAGGGNEEPEPTQPVSEEIGDLDVPLTSGFWDRVTETLEEVGQQITETVERITASGMGVWYIILIILILLLLILLILFLILRRKKKKEEEEPTAEAASAEAAEAPETDGEPERAPENGADGTGNAGPGGDA